MRPLILVIGPRDTRVIDLFGCSEPTPVRPGRPIVVTVSSSRKPGNKFARFEFPCTFSHIPVALQPIGDLFFLIATYQGQILLTDILNGFIYTRLTHELAQLFVDFLNYMYFRKLSWIWQVMHD